VQRALANTARRTLSGELKPAAARAITSALKELLRSMEVANQEARLKALEKQQGIK
jgi:hypothetical protein